MRTREESSAQGKAAKAAGKAWEAWIERQHARAIDRGLLAHVEHNEPHGRIIGGRVLYTGAGVADYTGVLTGGRYLAVEAKTEQSGRLARSRIKPKQAEHLDAVARAGGLALLLVEFRDGGACAGGATLYFAIPWARVPWKTLKTAESLDQRDALAGGWEIADGCYLSRFVEPRVDFRAVAGVVSEHFAEGR